MANKTRKYAYRPSLPTSITANFKRPLFVTTSNIGNINRLCQPWIATSGLVKNTNREGVSIENYSVKAVRISKLRAEDFNAHLRKGKHK